MDMESRDWRCRGLRALCHGHGGLGGTEGGPEVGPVVTELIKAVVEGAAVCEPVGWGGSLPPRGRGGTVRHPPESPWYGPPGSGTAQLPIPQCVMVRPAGPGGRGALRQRPLAGELPRSSGDADWSDALPIRRWKDFMLSNWPRCAERPPRGGPGGRALRRARGWTAIGERRCQSGHGGGNPSSIGRHGRQSLHGGGARLLCLCCWA